MQTQNTVNYYKERKNERTDEFIKKRSKYSKRTFLLLRKYLKKDKLKVLDVGSDIGIHTINLAKLLHNSDFTGIEPGKEAVKKAKELKKEAKTKNVRFIEGDAIKTEFYDESFDLILCEQVIEHVNEQKKLIKELYRLLKKEGILFISAPNRAFFWEPHLKKPFIHWFPKKITKQFLNKKKKEYFKHLFTISTLKLDKLLKKQGFKTVYIADRFFDKDICEVMFGRSFKGKIMRITNFIFRLPLGKSLLKLIFPYNGFIAIK